MLLPTTLISKVLKTKVIYNGIQEGFGRIPARLTFTDKHTGSTFLIDIDEFNLENKINKRLIELNRIFEKFPLT